MAASRALLLLSACCVLQAATVHPTTEPPSECLAPYTALYDRCVYVRNENVGDWFAARDYCHSISGTMIKLDDATLMLRLMDYIHEYNLTSTHYWIGATDEEHEGSWTWEDGTPVHMGTPFWGDWSTQVQEPHGGAHENCAFLNKLDHFYFHDNTCYDYQHHWGVICET